MDVTKSSNALYHSMYFGAWTIVQKADAPKLLILDWMMPGMDGLELCRKLRAKRPNDAFYIILLTSKNDPQDIAQGLEAGADDYISKPFENLELRARVNVGTRILALSDKMLEPEKNRCAVDAIDEICQEMIQPLQSVLAWSEMLLMDLPEDDTNYQALKTIKDGTGRIGSLARRIMNISKQQKSLYRSPVPGYLIILNLTLIFPQHINIILNKMKLQTQYIKTIKM